MKSIDSLTPEQKEKFKGLIKEELILRFNEIYPGKKISEEQKIKYIASLISKNYLIESITRGEETPSRVNDFKTRPFHEIPSLFPKNNYKNF